MGIFPWTTHEKQLIASLLPHADNYVDVKQVWGGRDSGPLLEVTVPINLLLKLPVLNYSYSWRRSCLAQSPASITDQGLGWREQSLLENICPHHPQFILFFLEVETQQCQVLRRRVFAYSRPDSGSFPSSPPSSLAFCQYPAQHERERIHR